jgi:hypothetical protein
MRGRDWKIDLLAPRRFDEGILELPIAVHDGRIVFVGHGAFFAPAPPYTLEIVDPDEHDDVSLRASQAARDNDKAGGLRPSIHIALRDGGGNGAIEWILCAVWAEDGDFNVTDRAPEDVKPWPHGEWFEANARPITYSRPDTGWSMYRSYKPDGTIDWSAWQRRQNRPVRLLEKDRDANTLHPADEGPRLQEERAQIELNRAGKAGVDKGLPDVGSHERARVVGDGQSQFASAGIEGAKHVAKLEDRETEVEAATPTIRVSGGLDVEDVRIAAKQVLNERQHAVFDLHLRGYTLEEIGRRLGVSKPRVHAIWTRDLEILSQRLGITIRH